MINRAQRIESIVLINIFKSFSWKIWMEKDEEARLPEDVTNQI
jgi:hypothetical protein